MSYFLSERKTTGLSQILCPATLYQLYPRDGSTEWARYAQRRDTQTQYTAVSISMAQVTKEERTPIVEFHPYLGARKLLITLLQQVRMPGLLQAGKKVMAIVTSACQFICYENMYLGENTSVWTEVEKKF